mmetsp:Transcript_8032/g.23909  ORF Transcript_8032/g.23909 Transcript_8032/m.23909 type:complete len:337 (+) Transcript_8032:235-1245(+)
MYVCISPLPRRRQIRLEHRTRRTVEPLHARSGLTTRRQLSPHLLRQHLPQFHPPLIERIDPPQEPLHGRPMLVQRQQLSRGVRVELREEEGRARTIPGEDLVRAQLLRHSLGGQIVHRLAVREGVGLSEEVGHELVVIRDRFAVEAYRGLRFAEAYEIGGNDAIPLMQELIEGMLTVRARLAEINFAGGEGEGKTVGVDPLSVRFHIDLLYVGRETTEGLTVRKEGPRRISQKGAVPHAQQSEYDGYVLPQRRVEEMFVHIVSAVEKSAHDVVGILKGEGHESDGRAYRESSADPLPETERLGFVDTEIGHAIDGGGYGGEMMRYDSGFVVDPPRP